MKARSKIFDLKKEIESMKYIEDQCQTDAICLIFDKLSDEYQSSHPHPVGVIYDWLKKFVFAPEIELYDKDNEFEGTVKTTEGDLLYLFQCAIEMLLDDNPDWKVPEPMKAISMEDIKNDPDLSELGKKKTIVD